MNKNTLKQENAYLLKKEEIKKTIQKFGFNNMLRYMIENLDNVDDLTSSQSLEMFKLISSLEDAKDAYERIFCAKSQNSTIQ